MKNPKWREAYPQGHKVKYGGKFLTTWSGYSLDLIQTNGGTISADKNRGYEDDQVNLSYTANEDYTFIDWSANKGSISENTYTFSNGNASALATWNWNGANPDPNYRLDFINDTNASVSNSSCKFTRRSTTGANGNVTMVSTGLDINSLNPISVGDTYAWKTEFKSNYSTNANIMEVAYVNGFGCKRPNATSDYVAISRDYKIIDFIPQASANGTTLGLPQTNWHNDVLSFGYVCNKVGTAMFCSAYYNKNYIGSVSANYSEVSGEHEIVFGEYYQTSAWSFPNNVGVVTEFYSSYNPMPGTAMFSMRSFDNVQHAIQWVQN